MEGKLIFLFFIFIFIFIFVPKFRNGDDKLRVIV
jgi:hypothetical protein